MGINFDKNKAKLTKEASTSMEDITRSARMNNTPGSVARPKSLCVPDDRYDEEDDNFYCEIPIGGYGNHNCGPRPRVRQKVVCGCGYFCYNNCRDALRKPKIRKNPVQRAASRLYRANADTGMDSFPNSDESRGCVGPEFAVRSTLPHKQLIVPNCKGSSRKIVTVILLNGQKLDALCNPNLTTAGQLFEAIIQKELIEENYILGLSAIIAGDFIFLPSDTRLCKAMPNGSNMDNLTLYLRVRFFLPSLRAIRGNQTRHLLYLQLRRSMLEHQLPCSFTQLFELGGLALQAEFGNFNEKEHGKRLYFLLEHYVPETMMCAVDDPLHLQDKLISIHKIKFGLSTEKAEEEFITLAQTLPQYGGHFYTATWMLKGNNHKDIWLYISSQGINLYERLSSASNCGPQLYEMFEWRGIRTLCYSKEYLCIIPHSIKLHSSKLKKYKLKMDNKKSYFAFRLASLHHQFFLRLKHEFMSLHTLSQQFGIPLKEMKNESNSLCKLESLNMAHASLDRCTVNAKTEFKIDFRSSSKCSDNNFRDNNYRCKRSKSINDFMNISNVNEELQNKENEFPIHKFNKGLIVDSSCLSGLPVTNTDKRRGVKMGTRAITNGGARISRSMEAVNSNIGDSMEDVSSKSVSLHYSNSSIPYSAGRDEKSNDAYILDSSIQSLSKQPLPDFQESLSESLLEKLNNFTFVEERMLTKVNIRRDPNGSLGVQITEGSDGNVYIQSVIMGGPAHLTGNVMSGDQIIAVNDNNLLGVKYNQALNILKSTGHQVEFILSRLIPSKAKFHSQATLKLTDRSNPVRTQMNLSNINEFQSQTLRFENTLNKLRQLKQVNNSFSNFEQNLPNVQNNNYQAASPVEKHLTESCQDISNVQKYLNLNKLEMLPYHKHIRYELEPELNSNMTQSNLNRNISRSCTQIFPSVQNDKAIIVGMIPKQGVNQNNIMSLDRKLVKGLETEKYPKSSTIALPRKLGLSRKWRGPVRYPVTPVKNLTACHNSCYDYNTASDDEQVFI